ncbi:monovalent cation/H(+) antiporter subunit G [Micromonospora sp. WMMD1082]|uniref:monovalent cation/H(+) antiporter subunit G n=1 Tax=Micromonospora sp. WMMD1082 TaxID=3016104 RepID=UPI002415B440|nr:monovalent cation/H(+) antiporter subunit G [Micromonospora sp. WMMD1082]MDG4792408.1 monovalent cation/H(+) antiporter subunit G [Micromonospora sp. WMMD1082]
MRPAAGWDVVARVAEGWAAPSAVGFLDAVNPTAVADWLGAASLVAGALLSLAAAIGVLRFPDAPSRMHAATKPQVLGVLLLLLGVALRLRGLSDLGMIALVGVFQLATAPVAAQMIGRAAYRSGQLDRQLLEADDMADR